MRALVLLLVPALVWAQPKQITKVSTNGLTADQISKVMKDNSRKFRQCYQRQLQKQPKLAGKVVVQFRILEDGTVRSGRVQQTTLKSRAVESCLVSHVMRLTFPASEMPSSVTFPFVFAQA